MKRFSYLLATASLLALAAAAGADDDQDSGWRQKHARRGGWGGVSQIVSDFKKHHGNKPKPQKDPIPIDPGRGDGRVPVDPVPLTPPEVRDHRDGATSPGGDKFVFVNGHWERVRANRDDFVFVNGHWERVKAAPKVVRPASPYPAGTTVRDHRTAPIVRDHRTAPIVRDHRTPPVVRDHRTDSANASGGVTVTSSSPAPRGPVIRDHRTQPVVRDHR